MPSFDAIDVAPERDTQSASGASEYLGRAASQRRITAAFTFLISIAALLLVRSVAVQLVRGAAFAGAAAQNRTRTELLVPTRGIIEDRNGVALVRNISRYAIGIVPADVPTGFAGDDVRARIAAAIGMDAAALRETLAQYPAHLAAPIAVRSDLAYDDAVRVLQAAAEIPAIRLIVDTVREYRDPAGQAFEGLSHVIGYVGRVSATEYAGRSRQRYLPSDIVGKSGVEAAAEALLRGTPGVRTMMIDARGRISETAAVEAPIAGVPVRLTIDRALQEATERALRTGLRASGARRGAAILLDPDSGDILALVNLPAFSNTAFARGLSESEYRALTGDPDHPLFPRAIAGVYPSGSTIKPMIAAMALGAGAIAPGTRILSTGGLRVGASFFPDWREGGHGRVDAVDALAHSVNTFFYVVGGGHPDFKFQISNSVSTGGARAAPLGPDGLAEALRAFGFGQPTGLDIAGEVSGLVPTPDWKREERSEPWYIGDTYHLAIGQGDLLVTPLQIAAATASIANGGYRVPPRLMRGRPGSRSPIVGLTAEALRVVRAGMRAAVTRGSARALSDLPFSIAGKTGTAQHAPGKRPHAWFTGFGEIDAGRLTAGAKRRVVITIVVEEGGEGSSVAVPIAREVLRAWAFGPTVDE